MELLKGKALKVEIGAIRKDGKLLTARIEHAAKSACVEAVNTRNTSAINMLADATKDIGSRALIRWLDKHGPVKWDKDADNALTGTKGAFVLNEKKYEAAKADVEAYAAQLDEAPTYIAAQAKSDSNPFTGLDFTARLKSLIKQADAIKADPDKAAAEGNDFQLLETVRMIVNGATVKVSATAQAPAPKPKSGKGKHVKLTAATETVATA